MRGMNKMNFNEKLMMLRKNKNLSQEQLGNELNVARQTGNLQRRCNNERIYKFNIRQY